MLLQFGPLMADVPEGWIDVTEQVPVPDPPITLARLNGAGALQFSTAEFTEGIPPNPMRSDLQEFLEQKAVQDRWGPPIRHETGTGSMMFASGEFRVGQDYMKAWYLSDGRNFAFATYVCDWAEQEQERGEVEAIVRSLSFAADWSEANG